MKKLFDIIVRTIQEVKDWFLEKILLFPHTDELEHVILSKNFIEKDIEELVECTIEAELSDEELSELTGETGTEMNEEETKEALRRMYLRCNLKEIIGNIRKAGQKRDSILRELNRKS